MNLKGYIKELLNPKKFEKNTGETIATFLLQTDSGTILRATGVISPIEYNDYIQFEGEVSGMEFNFTKYNFIEDDDIGATTLLKFLFGKSMYIKILQEFENNAVKAIQTFKNQESYFRNKCNAIKGISNKKIDKAYDKYELNITAEKIFYTFQKYGLTFDEAFKVYDVFGNDSLEIIREEPYKLFYDIKLKFNIVDKIALEYCGISKISMVRITAAVFQVLINNNKAGNTFMYLHKYKKLPGLIETVQKLIGIESSTVLDGLITLHKENKIVLDSYDSIEIVYIYKQFIAETEASNNISRLISKTGYSKNRIKKKIEDFEFSNKFILAEAQKDAILTSCQNRVSIITGPPGSGKTTIIEAIIETLLSFNSKYNIALAAPTGKAADKIAKSTGRKADTLHRLLKFSPSTGEFTYNESNKLPQNVFIIDEFSMVGLTIFNHFIKAIANDSILIMVGDYDQLPSVDFGKVLEDCIKSNRIPKTMLNEIYRQKKGSTLSKKILSVSKSQPISLSNTKDFEFVEIHDENKTLDSIFNIYIETISNVDDISKVVLLTPQNKGLLGVDNLNDIIQDFINPPGDRVNEVKSGKRIFREGDLVIQCVNEEKLSTFNGMVGKIIEIKKATNRDEKDEIIVDFGDIETSYYRDKFENIKLAYALTIHKTQGSEYDYVIMLAHEQHKYMLTRKLIYTGMSRAKIKLTIVGSESTIQNAIQTEDSNPRLSKLTERLANAVNIYQEHEEELEE